jgi:uncharacterized protein YecT (DUF1311 family)
MLRWTARIIALVIVTAAAAAPARAIAPSFDCRRAASPSEHAICRIERLAFRDRALGRIFSHMMVRLRPGQRARLRREQARWIAERDRACGADRECLEKRYEARIAVLSGRAARLAGRSDFTGIFRATKGLSGYIYLIDLNGHPGRPNVMAELETVNPSTGHQCTMHMQKARRAGAVVRWASPEARGCVVTITNLRDGVEVSGPPACRYYCGASGFFSGFYRNAR